MYPLFMVDAFAERPFTGNPAGVCLLEGPADNAWMQNVAMEMNQAETAFVYPLPKAAPGATNNTFSLRWFTPVCEVDLCGHATLAAAHILWETGKLQTNEVAHFETKSGTLTCARNGAQIEMDFPAERAQPENFPERMLELMEAHPMWFGRNRLDYLVELLNEEDVHSLRLDMRGLAEFNARGFIFTAQCTSGKADFISRYFAPAFGVPEDHATGSAHCALGPYWSEKLGKDTLQGFQASPRGAFIGVTTRGDRVTLRGKAVTTLKASIDA